MKCEICREAILTQYLEKPLGTVVKGPKGKKHWICNACQGKFHNDKAVMLRQLG
ncbi:MAG: hypothetical protein AABX47_06920 [Nanoarchaeota archaeon]